MAEVSRPAASLPEELLVEILARVPYRSLCRFRCVSPSWRALCSDPGLLRRSPQTLSGFFWEDHPGGGLRETRLLNFPGGGSGQRPLVDPSLPFLRRGGYTHGFALVDCCGGLLLCECFTSPSSRSDVDYVVCNPATEKWIVLPRTEGLHGPQKYSNNIRLGFDPADPSRFAVFVFLQDFYGRTIGLEIYSSETGTWTSEEIQWSEGTSVGNNYEGLVSVFLNGMLHLTAVSSVVTLDMDGKIWREIPPPDMYCYRRRIGLSQRRLHVMQVDHYSDDGCLLSVWVLDDYTSGDWTLKRTANMSELLGRQSRHVNGGEELYLLIAIHPDCDLIFFIDRLEKRLMSYDMDSQKVHVVYNNVKYHIGPYHPYTPCFAEWLSDSN